MKPDEKRFYRFVILSRNLTFDRSWDVSLCIESSDEVAQPEKTVPILNFLAFLRDQIGNQVPCSAQINGARIIHLTTWLSFPLS